MDTPEARANAEKVQGNRLAKGIELERDVARSQQTVFPRYTERVVIPGSQLATELGSVKSELEPFPRKLDPHVADEIVVIHPDIGLNRKCRFRVICPSVRKFALYRLFPCIVFMNERIQRLAHIPMRESQPGL